MTDNTLHDPLVNAANSGNSHKARVSPKLSVIIGPWYNTEYFVNAGYGYHSNDARGTVLILILLTARPFADGNPISPVSPLAWSRGAETGIRSNFIKGLNSTIALWFLESSQELVFVGDAGTTEVNGKSHRYGVELDQLLQAGRLVDAGCRLCLYFRAFCKHSGGRDQQLYTQFRGHGHHHGRYRRCP